MFVNLGTHTFWLNSYNLLSNSYSTGTWLIILHALSSLILTTTISGKDHYYAQYTAKEND
jgi:hypothetical protein